MIQFRPRHLYAQVRDELARRIAAGDYSPGSILPNEFAISQEMGVSVGTVRKALEILTSEKVLIRSQGRGTVVADRQSSDFRNMFDRIREPDGSTIDWRFRAGKVSVRAANKTEQRVLHLAAGDDIVLIVRVRESRGAAIKHEVCKLPAAAFGEIEAGDMRETTVERLAFARGVMIGSVDEHLSISRAESEFAKLFGVEQTAPVLKLDRLVYDSAYRPIEWRIAHCNLGDRIYNAPSPIAASQGREAPVDRRTEFQADRLRN